MSATKRTVAISVDTDLYRALEAMRDKLYQDTGYHMTRSAVYETALRQYVERGQKNE